MAQLTANKARQYARLGINEIGVAASAVIYEGSAVSEAASGFANQLVATQDFLGFALAKVDNTGGAGGAKTVQLQSEGLIVANLTVAQADLGAAVYMSDGDTFTLVSTSNTRVGTVYRIISTTQCVVRFKGPAPNNNTGAL